MRVSRIEARGFRCLRDIDVEIDGLVALVGANGSGKSALLNALRFFFGELAIDDRDCWSEDAAMTLEVALTFEFDGVPVDLRAFATGGNQLRVVRRSEPAESGRATTYVCHRMANPDFASIRNQPATPAKEVYEQLKAEEGYADLPAWRNHPQVKEALDAWEDAHTQELTPVEDGSIGYGSGAFDLSSIIEPVFVPAIRDASDDSLDSRTSTLSTLVDRIVNPKTLFAEGAQRLDAELIAKYEELLDTGRDDLGRAQTALSTRIARFAPGAAVKLEWDDRPPSIRTPGVRAELVEGGFATEIGRQGHGVQRAYILALLEELASSERDDGTHEPLLFMMIEEPELYQHPTRARTMARLLRELGGANERTTQVVYATHSPLFVGLDRIESLRLLKLKDGGPAPETMIHRVDLDAVATELWDAAGQPGERFTADTLRPRLRLLGQSPVSEGFFARGVVLVEGDEDVALIRAAGKARGWEFDDLGIAIVPVSGKNNLDRPLLVFRALGIPTYVVFDGDKSKANESASANRLLLALLAADIVDHPQTEIRDDWACFEEKIGVTVKSEVGAVAWDEAMANVCSDLGYSEGGTKNSMVMEEVHRHLAERGRESASLASVLRAIGRRFDL